MAKDRPKDLWNDLTPYVDGKNGGTRKAVIPARLGPLHRRGTLVLQTFVHVTASMNGTNGRERINATRVDYTALQLKQMLSGERKLPSGLSPKMLQKSLNTMTQREKKIAQNRRRMARSHAKKQAD